jgi:hypothetical protein
MNTALEYSTRVDQEGGRRCKKSTLNDLVHLTPLRIPLMNPPFVREVEWFREGVPSTAENLTIFIWNQLADKIPPPARLHEVSHHKIINRKNGK